MTNVHDFDAATLDGDDCSLGDYSGKVLLIVNVASKCGLTPHYEALERLQAKYDDFEVLGFPCNQFGGQEPGSDAEIRDFCTTNYGVTFDMFSKVDVNGDDRHPLFAHLTASDTLPDGPGDISWNFAKFVVDGDGHVVGRFPPPTDPEDEELIAVIEEALGEG